MKGAKSSPELTAKNVKNIVPLILSIWNKKLVFHHELLIIGYELDWDKKRALLLNNRLNEIEHETALRNTKVIEHSTLTSSSLQLLYAIALHL